MKEIEKKEKNKKKDIRFSQLSKAEKEKAGLQILYSLPQELQSYILSIAGRHYCYRKIIKNDHYKIPSIITSNFYVNRKNQIETDLCLDIKKKCFYTPENGKFNINEKKLLHPWATPLFFLLDGTSSNALVIAFEKLSLTTNGWRAYLFKDISKNHLGNPIFNQEVDDRPNAYASNPFATNYAIATSNSLQIVYTDKSFTKDYYILIANAQISKVHFDESHSDKKSNPSINISLTNIEKVSFIGENALLALNYYGELFLIKSDTFTCPEQINKLLKYAKYDKKPRQLIDFAINDNATEIVLAFRKYFCPTIQKDVRYCRCNEHNNICDIAFYKASLRDISDPSLITTLYYENLHKLSFAHNQIAIQIRNKDEYRFYFFSEKIAEAVFLDKQTIKNSNSRLKALFLLNQQFVSYFRYHPALKPYESSYRKKAFIGACALTLLGAGLIGYKIAKNKSNNSFINSSASEAILPPKTHSFSFIATIATGIRSLFSRLFTR